LWLGDVQGIEDAGIHRYVGKDVLDREVDRRARGGDHAVHRSLAGRARPRQIEVEVFALLADAELDAKRLVDDAVGIDEGVASVGTVGNGGDTRPHRARGARPQLDDRLLDPRLAVAVDQLRQAQLAHRQRRRLRLDVAQPRFGDADV